MPDTPISASRERLPAIDDTLAAIREYLQNIRFGSIALTIHDGKVVQLEVTEKRRLTV
jgi:hypothetical protein